MRIIIIIITSRRANSGDLGSPNPNQSVHWSEINFRARLFVAIIAAGAVYSPLISTNCL